MRVNQKMWSLFLSLLLTGMTYAGAEKESFVTAYQKRLAVLEKNLPMIVQSAEAVAKRWVEHKQVFLNTQFGGDNGTFAMEILRRAGGLGNIGESHFRRRNNQITSRNVFVIGPRCWERAEDYWRNRLSAYSKLGWMIVVFASQEGVPDGLTYDYLIDNGATDGSYGQAALNAVTNITNAWIWQCELFSALTRMQKHPAILKSMVLPGATEHNESVNHPKAEPTLYNCDISIPAGKLGKAYLEAVRQEIRNIVSEPTQKQITQAADIAVERITQGRTVWVSSFTHFLDGEVFESNLAPVKALRGISCQNGKVFTDNMKRGDLIFWWGEWTINLPWRNYQEYFRSAGVDYIPSYRPLGEGEEYDPNVYPAIDDVSDALMVLEQKWPFEGAVVPIPVAPGTMAPVTGVSSALLYRMLDEAIHERLQQDSMK